MKNLNKICSSEVTNSAKDTSYVIPKEYFTFEEMFLEKPALKHPGEDKIYMSPSIPVPMPTFCTLAGIPLIDDADMLE